MKKFFIDTDSREVQTLPSECRAPEVLEDQSKFIMMCHGESEDGWSYQVLFSTQRFYDNNSWHVFVFDEQDEFVDTFSVPSVSAIPPVWNRQFGGIDYFDYIKVMSYLNAGMDKAGKAHFPRDDRPEGKFVYFVNKSYDEIMNLVKEGKSYEILAIKAEEYLKNHK